MNKRGFTLIELVLVIAIIAILAAILFPVFAKAREKARQASCANNLTQMWFALRVYAQDNDGFFPPGEDFGDAIIPYLRLWQILTCPSNPTYYGESGYAYAPGWNSSDPPYTPLIADRLADVHNDGGNFLLLDGRVKWFSAEAGAAPKLRTKDGASIRLQVRAEEGPLPGEGPPGPGMPPPPPPPTGVSPPRPQAMPGAPGMPGMPLPPPPVTEGEV